MMRRVLALAVCLGAATASAARAQDTSAGNVAFSYMLLKDKDIDGVFPKGWLGAIAGRLSNAVEIVGEVGQSRKSETEPTSGLRASLKVLHYGAGPRFVARKSARAIPFGQILLGGVRVSASLDSCGTALTPTQCNEFNDDAPSSNGFAVQPGGGVDLAISRAVAIRVQSDYRYIRIEDGNLHEFRFATGVVLRFGS